jgi:protein-tyrosine phosphatase
VSAAPFTVLVVCTGNICRSPLGEQLLAARLDDRFVVTSAGTYAETGSPMESTSAEMSRRYGGSPENHVAQDLTRALLDEADLVLTASRDHRSAVVSMMPSASRKAFTLRQFARLVDHATAEGSPDEVADPAALVALAAMSRGEVPRPDDPRDDDVEDPYGRSLETHERVAAQIDDAVTRITSGFEAAR